MKTTFKLTGLRCVACTKLINLKLSKIKGVGSCLVNLNGETEIVSDKAIDVNEVIKALAGTNYQVKT